MLLFSVIFCTYQIWYCFIYSSLVKMVTFLPTCACAHIHRIPEIYINNCSWTETVSYTSVPVQEHLQYRLATHITILQGKITPLFNQFYTQKTSMQTKPREQNGVEGLCLPAPPSPWDLLRVVAVMRCWMPSSDAMFLSLEIHFCLPCGFWGLWTKQQLVA